MFEESLKENSYQPLTYQIKLKGYLDLGWSDWFENVTIYINEAGDTCLTCLLPDQAALYGLLKKIRDLGLFLLSLQYMEAKPGDGRVFESKT